MNGRQNGLFLSLLIPVSVFFGSCSGSGGDGSAISVGCADGGQALCVTRCNLGCSVTGCNISEIAVNQPLSFDFNLDINPDTVNSNTIKMRTASGKEPVGTFLVQGQTVFFFPEAKVIGNQTFFGFESGESYTLTIPSGRDSLDTLESMSGDAVGTSFVCRLQVSRGIVDFDGKPPAASLLVPSVSSVCVGVETLILLEFSEIVDAATLIGDSTTAGVRFGLAQFDAQGNCSARSLPISGTRTVSVDRATQRSRLLFRPSFVLPGDFCVRVQITDKVRDLAGKRAKAVNFEFKTCQTVGVDKCIEEDFSNAKKNRDDERNGAKWATNAAVPAVLGGSGRLGDFNVRFGQDLNNKDSGKIKDADGRTIYFWNTDNTVVPGIRTLSGKDVTIDNGVYEFTSFELKEGEHLRFTGSKMPLIRVAGRMSIAGVLSMAAEDGTKPASPTKGRPPLVGQVGYAGAIGAGGGGRGGDSPHKTGTKKIDGSDGEIVQLPTGHPLSSSVAVTGGKGSKANPASGKDTDACFTAYQATISQQGAAGGGGGGFVSVGAAGTAVDNKTGFSGHPPQTCDIGTPSVGGTALPFSTLFNRTEKSSFLYLLGGSGGGGGGAHPHGAFDERPKAVLWSPGGGGLGGGGPMHLQIGGDLFVSARGTITVQGGSSPVYPYDTNDFWNLAPGGGGSGGTLLVQLAGLPDIRGVVTALGGTGGRMDSKANFDLRLDSLSGKGGDGFIRFEANPKIDTKQLLTLQPAVRDENSGLLRSGDYNTQSLLATNFYDTNLFFPPKYLRVEIVTTINNQEVVFSDDSTKGIVPDENAAITFLCQGAQLDPDTKLPNPDSLSAWFSGGVDGLNRAGGNGYRFILVFNLDKAADTVVKSVKVYFRG